MGEFEKRIKEVGDYSGRIDEILKKAKKEFPIEFWWTVVTEDEYGKTVEKQEIMPKAKLPKNRANARIDKNKVIDWVIKYFGAIEKK